MIGASKILTVSYGTFSCTLEGFDDPFNTMKAIAEYFRDLAAGDRYFGAEPPTPDAAMLHRIAEREVQRRVEASVQDNGVILRAQPDHAPTALMPAVSTRDAPLATAFMQDSAPARQPARQDASDHAASVPAATVTPETTKASTAALPERSDEAASEPQAATSAFEATLDVGEDMPATDTFADSFLAAPAPDAPATVETAPVPQPGLTAMPEGVVARLARIRAAVALTDAARSNTSAPVSDYAEDQHAEAAFADFETFEDTVVPSLSDVSFIAPEDVDETAGLAALDGVSLSDVLDAYPIAEPVSGPAADSVQHPAGPFAAATDTAENDQKYAPLYLRTETTSPVAEPAVTDDLANLADANDPDLAEDLYAGANPDHADDLTDDQADDWADDFADDLTAASPNDVSATQPAATAFAAYDDSADDDVLASLSAAFAADTPAADTLAADTLATATTKTEAPPVDDDEVVAALSAIETAAQDPLPAALTTDLADDLAGMATDIVPVLADTVQDPAFAGDQPAAAPANAEPAADAATAPDDKVQRARARIIRVRRAPVISSGSATAPAETETAVAALSDEAEAELQRELAALEDGSTDLSAAAPAAAAISAEDADDALRRQLSALGAGDAPTPAITGAVALAPSVQDEALRRLMDQTQSEMAEPGNRRRLSSIAHLKAAVAATIAERFGNKPKPAEEVEATRAKPYRNDLARAVRPVRPAGAGTLGNADRPTPLVLVSEQRIDRPAPAAMPAGQVTPVRPRRVSAQAVAMQPAYEEDELEDEVDDTANIFGDSKGFAEFADRMGATDLSELLEAAAAYSSAVEGRTHFTRPQLLRQISALTGADVSREDELRGFGSLLREGRILKIKRGQFALTAGSRFLAEAKKITD